MNLTSDTSRLTVIGSKVLSRPRLMCAISEDERRLFLNHCMDRIRNLQSECLWAGKEEIRDSEMFFLKWKPEILVTAWSTPSVLYQWLESPDCSTRYVCHLNGEVRRLVPRAFLERGGLVTNWGKLASFPVAEHALLMALGALRNMGIWRSAIKDPMPGSLVEGLGTQSLRSRKVGLHGFGKIAQELVKLLRPFDVSISVYSEGVPAHFIRAQGVKPCTTISELFSVSEVLFECEALKHSTIKSVKKNILAMLPDGAVFVNVARGELVDEQALLREASSGRIRVALDVMAVEPVTAKSPFYQLNKVLLSPHIAGPTFDQYRNCGEFALKNIERYLEGGSLEELITLDVYDRST